MYFKPIVILLKLLVRIIEVFRTVLVLISQVAALNWSDTIYPNLGYSSQKRRKSTFWREKRSESNLDMSDVPEIYFENSWGPYQCFSVNQPSGRAQLKWHHIPKLRVPPWKTPKIENLCTKIDLKVILKIVMFLKLMLEIDDAFSNILILISHVAALNWSYTIYPNLEYPR